MQGIIDTMGVLWWDRSHLAEESQKDLLKKVKYEVDLEG